MNPEQLAAFAAQIEQMAGQAPPEQQDMVRVLGELVQERLDAAGGGR